MIELLTPDEMSKVDARAIEAGADGFALMENAGGAVANLALERWPAARSVLVLAGPGNNGGDGFVAARKIAEAGRRAIVGLLGERDRLKGDAARAAASWRGETIPIERAEFASSDLVIDALFGAGLSRPLDGLAAKAVDAATGSGKPILAVDVPSGLDGATGRPSGDVCVRAEATATFVRLKPGHVLTPGRTLCGDVRLFDIGMPAVAIEPAAVAAYLNRPALWRATLPEPSIEGHKYSRGHVAVWSGPALASGASRLSALSALRAGAGAVTLVGDLAALQVHAAHVTAVMLHEVDAARGWAPFLADRRASGIVVGPGAGATAATLKALRQALETEAAVALDADVFSLFAEKPDDLASLIGEAGGRTVLTPHEGEFRRLFGGEDGQASKLERAKVAASRLGATIVLKGPDTVVAAPDGRAAIADNAPPYLATAGAGDVLAGVCAGLMAQRMPAFEAAAAAVWMHGEAAKVVGRGLIADDLPDALPTVLRALDQNAG